MLIISRYFTDFKRQRNLINAVMYARQYRPPHRLHIKSRTNEIKRLDYGTTRLNELGLSTLEKRRVRASEDLIETFKILTAPSGNLRKG